MTNEIDLLCECNSMCCLPVTMPLNEAKLVVARAGVFIISDECEYGPSKHDVYVSSGHGYKVYATDERAANV